MTRAFLDTNVLVYAFDHRDPRKQTIAREVVDELRQNGTPIVSTQVLQEFFLTTTSKLPNALSREDARESVRDIAQFHLVQATLDLILQAIERVGLMSISFWDALIVEAALLAGAEVLYTEDLNHGQVIDGLRIVNPFLSS